MYILKIFYSFIKNYKFTIFIYILFTIFAFPLESIVLPQIYSHFFDTINSKTKANVFIKYFIMLVIILSIVHASNSMTTYIESYMIPDLNSYIINYIFKNLLIKHQNSFTEIELAKIITKITSIPIYLKEMVTHFCIWIFPRFLTIVLINIYFFYLNWKLGLVSITLLFIFICISYYFFKRCSNISTKRYLSLEEKNQYTQDKLSNLFSIYSSGNIKKEINNYNDSTKHYTNIYKDNLSCLNKSTITTSILIVIIFISLNTCSTYLFLKKQLTYINLIAIFITIIYYIPCIVTICNTMPDMTNCYGSLKSVDTFIEELYNINNDKKNDINDNEIINKITRGDIIINNLNFGYSKDNKLFKNFYLTIKQNEKIAIIGSSGNGKSTLIKLIMGYYSIDPNSIFIDGIDINNYNLNDLRKQISYINQNNKLFNLSLLENIQYGNNLTKDEIINICDRLNINSIFKNLKDGYETNVGVDGNNLSGGQKQLVYILRSMGNKNKIIILDEPTSAIDKDNKDNIMNAIKELSNNNTMILITHDDSILSCVDRVITLDSGQIQSDIYLKK